MTPRDPIELIPPARLAKTSVMALDPGDEAGGLCVIDVDPTTGRPGVRWVLSYAGRSARLWSPGQPLITTSSGCLLGLLQIAPPFVGELVCEQLKPFKGFNRGFRVLVEAAGGVKHWARARGCTIAPTEPDPGRWRADVLHIRPGTPADTCAAAAVAAVEGRPVPGSRYDLRLGLREPVRPIDEHGAEAVCIGLWALGYRATVSGGGR